MNRIKCKLRVLFLTVMLICVFLSASVAGAQIGGGFDMSWNNVGDGAGGYSAAGSYELYGTLGQPEASTASGGGYIFVGGFWAGTLNAYKIYLPLVLK